MKKMKNFSLLWKYLKNEKAKMVIYIILVILSYLPVVVAPIFWGHALEALILKDMKTFVLFLSGWSGMYIVFYSILQIPRDMLYNNLEILFTKNISKDLFKKSLDLPSIAFEDIGVGELINRLYTDPDRIVELLAKLIRMLCKFTVVIVVFILCFKTSLLLGLELLVFAIIMGLISAGFFPKIKKEQEAIKKESDLYVKSLTEDITGIREIKSLGIKKNIRNYVNQNIENLFIKTKKQKKYEVLYFTSNNFCFFVLQFIILFTCGYLFVKGNITYSVFIMLEVYIWRIDDVVESISDFGVNYNKIAVSLKRMNEILDNVLYKDEHYGKEIEKKQSHTIAFKKVKFHYRKGEKDTLAGLNLVIEPHKKIAVVGRSGNGKSTIFNLLLRYFDATQGKVTIDNIPIQNFTEEALRSQISIIRQSPFLFNLSIFDNFKLVKEDVTLEEVRKACKKAYIDDYVMSLQKGYETIIGEGGVNLSGGQKQRIAIARTLLLNTPIILFDEATSALDNESQEYIKKTINDLTKDHTVIIVAHRLSTIMDADVIHVIDAGKLAASGSHKELLKNSETYKKLYTSESIS
ncbi:MAG: ABC transporter ATP-binding protein [Bacilli bacterium]|nr:ABC transporter ATP-binding protein [Bacilli bacterium]